MPVPERPGFTSQEVCAVLKYIHNKTIVDQGISARRITSKYIIKACGLKSLFHLTDIVHHIRTQLELPICSGSKGYWWGTNAECEVCGTKLIARANKMAQAGQALYERNKWKQAQTRALEKVTLPIEKALSEGNE